MAYSIRIKKSVEKDIRKIDKNSIVRIMEAIQSLEENPRPRQSLKLRDTESTYRLRVGEYRVIYQVDDKVKEVVIFHIRHRKNVYRSL